MKRYKPDWRFISFFAVLHVLGTWGYINLVACKVPWQTMALALVLHAGTIMAIGGYHRCFSHRGYRVGTVVKLYYALFGAMAGEMSILKWCSQHRRHHARTDTPDDPYDATRGFWWSHIGWLLVRDGRDEDYTRKEMRDLTSDPIVMWQHRYYLPLFLLFAFGIPTATCGLLWGDWSGGFLVASCLRLMAILHSTFCVNSLAHLIGTQPYDTRKTPRDSWVTALITFGEGYHNLHHRFPRDYRNGIHWWQFDPNGWVVWWMEKFGIATDVVRTPWSRIEAAMEEARRQTDQAEQRSRA